MTFKCLIGTAQNLNKAVFIGKQLEIKYRVGPDKGRTAEEKALLLVKTFFDDVEDAFLAKKGVLLDVSYKVDLVVKFREYLDKDGKIRNKKALGIQVKSSEVGAAKHEELRNSRDWEFGFPECLTLAMGTRMVSKLVKLLHKEPNQRFFDALARARDLGGNTWPKGIPGMDDLVVLGLAKQTTEGYVVRPTR